MLEAINSFHIIAIYLLVVFIFLTSFETGFRISRYLHLKKGVPEPKSLGLTGALLGMLAFVLAFTFSMAASHFKKRKEMVLVETNVLGTAYLRAGLVDQPHERNIKQLLREYVNTRLEGVDPDKVDQSIERSIQIHQLLWKEVQSAAMSNPNTNTSLLIQSINEVIDTHENRLAATFQERIPDSIWITLIVISVITVLTLGLTAGFGNHRRLIVVIPLVMAYAALITLVAELDMPQKGVIKVGQEAMISLQKSINSGS